MSSRYMRLSAGGPAEQASSAAARRLGGGLRSSSDLSSAPASASATTTAFGSTRKSLLPSSSSSSGGGTGITVSRSGRQINRPIASFYDFDDDVFEDTPRKKAARPSAAAATVSDTTLKKGKVTAAAAVAANPKRKSITLTKPRGRRRVIESSSPELVLDDDSSEEEEESEEEEMPRRRGRPSAAASSKTVKSPKKTAAIATKTKDKSASTAAIAPRRSRGRLIVPSSSPEVVSDNSDGSGEDSEEDNEETRAKREEDEKELLERWMEEYYEIVEQLPLELHRSYALMREQEAKFQGRIARVASQTKAYRSARFAYRKLTPAQKELHDAFTRRAIEQERALRDATLHAQQQQQQQQQQQHEVEKLAQQEQRKGKATSVYGSEADAEGEEDDAEVFQAVTGETFVPAAREQEAGPSSAVATTTLPAARSAPTTPATTGEPSKPAAARKEPGLGQSTSAPSLPAPSRAERVAMLASIAQASSEALRAADEKVGLAKTAYEWVDRQIRRLDADLQKSENVLLLGLRAGTEASRGLQDALGVDYDGKEVGKQGATGAQGAGRWADMESLLLGHPATRDGKRADGRKGRKAAEAQRRKASGGGGASKATASAAQTFAEESFAPDMTIDPNEPRYCYCDEVSAGQMIGCDNDDCPREWFHYDCIGFNAPPKGDWYCLFCGPVMGFKGPKGTFPPDAPFLPPGEQAGGSSSTTNSSGGGREKPRQAPRGPQRFKRKRS